MLTPVNPESAAVSRRRRSKPKAAVEIFKPRRLESYWC